MDQPLVMQLGASAMLGVLSIALARVPKPRFFWGSAVLDPTGFPWMIALLLFGPLGALLSSIIGAVAIWRLSPEPTPALGASLKFTGTAVVWLTLAAGVAALGGGFPNAALGDFRTFLALTLLAGLLRATLICPFNYVVSIPYYRSVVAGRKLTRAEAFAEFGSVPRYFLTLGVFNLWISFVDAVVPWLLVYPTGLALGG